MTFISNQKTCIHLPSNVTVIRVCTMTCFPLCVSFLALCGSWRIFPRQAGRYLEIMHVFNIVSLQCRAKSSTLESSLIVSSPKRIIFLSFAGCHGACYSFCSYFILIIIIFAMLCFKIWAFLKGWGHMYCPVRIHTMSAKIPMTMISHCA